MTTFKIGINKGKKRIWIDGRKLAEAGFTGGKQYRAHAADHLTAFGGTTSRDGQAGLRSRRRSLSRKSPNCARFPGLAQQAQP